MNQKSLDEFFIYFITDFQNSCVRWKNLDGRSHFILKGYTKYTNTVTVTNNFHQHMYKYM